VTKMNLLEIISYSFLSYFLLFIFLQKYNRKDRIYKNVREIPYSDLLKDGRDYRFGRNKKPLNPEIAKTIFQEALRRSNHEAIIELADLKLDGYTLRLLVNGLPFMDSDSLACLEHISENTKTLINLLSKEKALSALLIILKREKDIHFLNDENGITCDLHEYFENSYSELLKSAHSFSWMVDIAESEFSDTMQHINELRDIATDRFGDKIFERKEIIKIFREYREDRWGRLVVKNLTFKMCDGLISHLTKYETKILVPNGQQYQPPLRLPELLSLLLAIYNFTKAHPEPSGCHAGYTSGPPDEFFLLKDADKIREDIFIFIVKSGVEISKREYLALANQDNEILAEIETKYDIVKGNRNELLRTLLERDSLF